MSKGGHSLPATKLSAVVFSSAMLLRPQMKTVAEPTVGEVNISIKIENLVYKGTEKNQNNT